MRGITSKHYCDFYGVNFLHFFRIKNKFESHKRVRKNEDFFIVIMRSKDAKILEYNQYQKSDKVTFIIYPDLEYLIGKIDGCKKLPEN